MSMEQSVVMQRTRMPTTAQISDKCRALGFDLTLDEADLIEHTGFLPCTLGGAQTGFEWYAQGLGDGAASDANIDPAIRKHLEGRDTVVTWRTGSIEAETQAAMICAAAMIELTDGVYFDEYDNIDTTPDRLLAEVREWLNS
ncbi:MAG: hypothetical protein KDA16_13835 [Phycisphaerales bacterium]|nr:hypothetical protein [Phycisphaerales bacterium]